MRFLARPLGHPIHPALVHFPIAFWTAVTVLDICTLLHVYDGATFAWYCLIVTTIAALPAMATGMVELTRLESSAQAVANRHMLLMCSTWTLYLVSMLTRLSNQSHRPDLLSVSCSLIGLVLMIVGGWFGAKLVYEHGAGRTQAE
jgi:uncharacterized membrane protein